MVRVMEECPSADWTIAGCPLADRSAVLWEEAREWAELEISRKGPSSAPLMDQLIWDSEVARLAHERMEELMEQSR